VGNQYQDGAVPYGSRVVAFKRVNSGGGSGVASTWTALANATTVVLENISVKRSGLVNKIYDELKKPSKSYGQEDFPDGSAVAQLAKDPTGTTTVALQFGDAFTTTFDASIGAESFVITSVDQPEEQGSYKKQSISFMKLIGVTP
jgi:hypothetical protein